MTFVFRNALGGIRKTIEANRVFWQRHALERMIERRIRREDVIAVVLSGEIIEEYPDDKPFPSALYLGRRDAGPLHVVIAFDASDRVLHVITAYEPDSDRFGPDFRARRPVL